MTVAEAIRLAEAWQEADGHVGSREEMERMATQFSYALLIIRAERQAALNTLADFGFATGPLNQRVMDACKAAGRRRS